MVETLDWVLYDEATFGTSAVTEHQLFASALGSASARTRFVTNSPGNAELQNTQSFEIHNIKTWVDSEEILADLELIYPASYLRLNVLNKEVLQIPLQLCFGAGAWGGFYSEASGTLARLINTQGDGFKLTIPLVIPRGGRFEVYLGQSLALANVTQVKLALIGKLTRD